jgi:acetoin utilization protein AcuB
LSDDYSEIYKGRHVENIERSTCKEKAMQNLRERSIRDWMTPDPVTITSGTTLPDAYWLMVNRNIRRLPVVDNGQLVGVVTMEDIRSAIPGRAIPVSNPLVVNEMLSQMPVAQLMTRDPITIDLTASVAEAAQKMLTHKISTLPVMEAGKVVGIITESDLFRVLVDMCLG